MLKNLSGWYRLFIVFAGVWSIIAIGILVLLLDDISYNKERIEEARIGDVMNLCFDPKKSAEEFKNITSLDLLKVIHRSGGFENPKDEEERLITDGDWHTLAKLYVSKYKEQYDFSNIEKRYNEKISEHRKDRRLRMYFFPLYWLVPIGFVYGTGWTTGWIYRGFRKNNF